MNESGSGLSHVNAAFKIDEDLMRTYYRHLDPEDRRLRQEDELRRRLTEHVEAGAVRHADSSRVTVTVGDTATLVYVITDDMPFLVDSVTNGVLRHTRELSLVMHPTFVAHRDDDGGLLDLLAVPAAGPLSSGDTAAMPSLGGLVAPAGAHARVESWICVEIDERLDADAATVLSDSLGSVLEDVRAAVTDWTAMRDRTRALAAELRDGSLPLPAAEAAEAAAMLQWLDEGNFTFLGYREYELEAEDGRDLLRPVEGSGLGLMRRAEGTVRELTGVRKQRAREPRALVLTTANRRSTVHRNVYLDYVGVKSFGPDGQVTGERRIIGLFSSSSLNSVRSVPVIRTKVDQVLADSGFAADSHTGKDIITILEGYPREELFQTDVATLSETVTGILRLQERRATRVFLREDIYGRFVSALVFLPRDRYTTPVRLRVEGELRSTFHAVAMDFDLQMGESALVRLYYRIRLPEAELTGPVDRNALESRLARAVRSWGEGISTALAERLEPARAVAEAERWAEAFPPEYRVVFEIEDALRDAGRFEALSSEQAEGIGLHLGAESTPDAGPRDARLKLYLAESQPLSTILPVLGALGLEVRDERPYAVTPSDGRSFHLYDLGVRLPEGVSAEAVAPLVEEAYRAVMHGRAESDPLQALITAQGFSWREVAVLRAYVRYLRQLGVPTAASFAAATLLRHPEVAAALVGLFHALFDPRLPESERQERIAARRQELTTGLESVATLDADRLVRRLSGVIEATLRTNYYQDQTRLAFKLSTREIEDAPLPRPRYEIWVYSPMVEGVHLRFGDVARGGLRWSDRAEDFRTEILGLVKAQTVKNAVIVPTGAKGGFFAKQLPDPALDRSAWMDAGKAAYSEFIRSLLDVTDNLDTGEQRVLPPADVVRRDGDDTYLVVAADKGTASFSDLANSLAAERDFWLGDAFASGGSVGYDHKAMGITARGAWESVKRHFFELGVDVQAEDFTMVGIGDMSGDVFGNGLLRSQHTRLVAAFDHRHVFIDPDPDPASSFCERQRLFELPRSSWDDYDRSVISEGGGVFARQAKSVPLTPQIRTALGLDESVQRLSPPELIRAVLRAPVDLLYNGGVGTYVKAADESDAQVGDRSNDAIRVDGGELRVKVIGEGGNLGLTQRGRIEAALAGILVNTDAIDNSAGVDCSDHEVNIKIPVDALVRDGALAADDRAALLHSFTEDVGDLVLRDNFAQNVLLVNEKQDPAQWGASQERLMRFLEEHADLDRDLEFLPGSEAFEQRLASGVGLTTPELSVIVAYAKIQLATALTASDLPDDPALESVLNGYFPQALARRYGEALEQHPLRREIIATVVANDMVNLGGASYAFRAMEETGTDEAAVAKAFLVLRRVYGMDEYVREVNALPASIGTEHWTRLHRDLRRLLDRTTRWYVEHIDAEEPLLSTVERYEDPIRKLTSRMSEFLIDVDAERVGQWHDEALGWGLSDPLAARWAQQFETFPLLDVVRVADRQDVDPATVAGVYYAVYAGFGVDRLLDSITALPREDRWQTLARAALRDDLYATVAELCVTVLAETDADQRPEERLAAWQATQAERLERASRTFDEVISAGRQDMSSLSVALRMLRSIVRR